MSNGKTRSEVDENKRLQRLDELLGELRSLSGTEPRRVLMPDTEAFRAKIARESKLAAAMELLRTANYLQHTACSMTIGWYPEVKEDFFKLSEVIQALQDKLFTIYDENYDPEVPSSHKKDEPY